MGTIVEWLEAKLDRVSDDLAHIEMELDLSILYTEQKRDELEKESEYLACIKDWLADRLEDERQRHETDWQAECLEWRRGVGVFMDYMNKEVLKGVVDDDTKDLMEGELFVYEEFIRFCPQAIIDWNVEVTPEEVERVKKLAEDEGLI